MRCQLTGDGVPSMNHRSQPTSFMTKTPRHCHPSCHLTPPSFMQSSSLAGYKPRSIPYHHQAKANDGGLKDPWGRLYFVLLPVPLLLIQTTKQRVQIPAHVASLVGVEASCRRNLCGARSAYAPPLMPAHHLFAPSTNPSPNFVKRRCGAIRS
jgi:hypothetical protein